MEEVMTTTLWLGLIAGILFGVLLQKGRALRFDKLVGAIRLRDMTVLKLMLSAILVGMVGLYALSDLKIIELSHKSMNIGGIIVGGVLFGIGWAITGYCPSTSVGALGEGRWNVVFAILGMLTGAAIYAELYPFFKSTVLAWSNFGKVGLPEVLGVSPWLIILVFWAGTIALFSWFEKKNL